MKRNIAVPTSINAQKKNQLKNCILIFVAAVVISQAFRYIDNILAVHFVNSDFDNVTELYSSYVAPAIMIFDTVFSFTLFLLAGLIAHKGNVTKAIRFPAAMAVSKATTGIIYGAFFACYRGFYYTNIFLAENFFIIAEVLNLVLYFAFGIFTLIVFEQNAETQIKHANLPVPAQEPGVHDKLLAHRFAPVLLALLIIEVPEIILGVISIFVKPFAEKLNPVLYTTIIAETDGIIIFGLQMLFAFFLIRHYSKTLEFTGIIFAVMNVANAFSNIFGFFDIDTLLSCFTNGAYLDAFIMILTKIVFSVLGYIAIHFICKLITKKELSHTLKI